MFYSQVIFWVFAFLILQGLCTSDPREDVTISGHNDRHTSFQWNSVQATRYLNYTSCYDGFECARLEVPLDWNNASNPNKVQLAIIRLPASVPKTDPSFGGTILFNPGGPGGSGIDVMRWTGHGIREVVDNEKHFEILSWDPRGMQHTTPSLSCFKDDWDRQVWTYRNNVVGPMDISNASLIQRWALGRSFGKLCEETSSGTYPDGSSIAQFATTALVVRDMVEIVDKVEHHRLQTVKSLRPNEKQHAIESHGPALLNYWGYSYGSYLGNSFASMFPSRVGRVILDSVVDTDDYTATGWFSNLQDHHKALDFFYHDCFEAGHLCALNRLNVACPADIAATVENLLEQIRRDPIVVLHQDVPDIVTFADISSLLLATMYFPRWSWPELAEILADLVVGNGTSVVRYLQALTVPATHPDEDELGQQLNEGKNKTNPYPPGYPGEGEAGRAVMCGDGDDLTHLSVDDWYGRLRKWHAQSPIVGWRWSENPMLCAHWPKSWRPAEHNRFKGPWTSKLKDYDSRASPLLFIGGTADPALPLKNAYKAAVKHEGAHVLIQDAPGHCTGYINPSLCTWQHIRRFFADGVLPANNTVCQRDDSPWQKF